MNRLAGSPSSRSCTSAGLTLVETVVALAMFALVALALESSLLVATRALPDARSAGASFLAAARVHDQIASELFYAQNITEMAGRAITFTVADRDNDGVSETIRYYWSGTPGDPLTRQYNGRTPQSVLDDVRELTFNFDKRAVKQPTTFTEGPEQQIFVSGKGLVGGGASIDMSNFVGESIPAPAWSSDVVMWRVTRARVIGQQTASGAFRVQVRPSTSGGLPGGVIADQVNVPALVVSNSTGAFDVAFSGAPTLVPGSGVCLVFRQSAGSSAPVSIWCNNLNLSSAGDQIVTTSNAGASWQGNTLRAVAMAVYAAGSTKDADSFKYYLTDIRLQVRSGADPAGRMTGTFRVPSEPQVSG